jgi:hypothetical protein
MIYPFPHPLLLPLGKVIEHDAIGRKIVRQPSPGATLPHKIKDRLEDRSLTITRRPPQLAAKWKQLLQNIPFFTFSARRAVRQVHRLREVILVRARHQFPDIILQGSEQYAPHF